MANSEEQIRFDIDLGINSSDLDQDLNSILSRIQNLTEEQYIKINPEVDLSNAKDELKSIKQDVSEFENIWKKAFNQKIGELNLTTFNKELKNSNVDLSNVYNQMSKLGQSDVFRRIANDATKFNVTLKEAHPLLKKMSDTLANTIKWNLASGAVNNISGSIQQAWGFTKSLDTSLNNIQIVTNKSSEDMAKFAIQANNAAKALGSTTTAYSDAALTFYQQGLDDENVAARAEVSTKVSNVTGLSGDQSAEYVTAVLNGYKVAAEDAEAAMDKLAAVGANTASSLAELSEAMAKVASSANAMGVSEDQLAATLSTVISVTRQDASSVGTAFKTIYARISDIKAGSAEAEVSLGNYTKKMAEMGFNVLDSAGNMRDLGEVMEEIGGKWETLTKEQQISLAQTMAGTRQYNNLIALFDNWAQYEDALNVSMEANGTLQQQQEVYAESLTAKLNELKAAKEGLFMNLVDNDVIKTGIDGLTKLVGLTETFIKSIGGMKGALAGLSAILLKVYSKDISKGLATSINNLGTSAKNKIDSAAQLSNIQAFSAASKKTDANGNPMDDATKRLLEFKQELADLNIQFSEEQKKKINEMADAIMAHNEELEALEAETAELEKQKELIEQKRAAAEEFFARDGSDGKDSTTGENYTDEDKAVMIQSAMEDDGPVINSINGLIDAENELSMALDVLRDAEEQAMKDSTLTSEQRQQAIEEVVTAYNNAEEAIKVYKEQLESLSKEEGLSKSQKDAVNKAKNNFNDTVNPNGTGTNRTAAEVLKNITRQEKALKSVNKTVKDVENSYRKEGKAAVEAFENSEKDAKKNNKALEETRKKVDSVKDGLKGIDKEKFDLKEKLQLEQFSQGVIQCTQGISQLAMGISSITAIPDLFENTDMSTGQTIIQLLMTMSMAVSGTLGGMKAFGQGMDMIKNNMGAFKDNLKESINAMIEAQAVEKTAATAAEENAAATGMKTKATQVSTTVQDAENVSQEVDNTLDAINNTETAEGVVLTGAKAGANVVETGTEIAKNEQLTIEVALKALLGALDIKQIAITAALAVTVGIAVAAYKNYKKALEEKAKAAEAEADKAHENTQQKLEEKQKVDDLVSSYQSLREEYDKQGISLYTMQRNTAKLLDDIGRHDLAVQALTADYEKLNELVNQVQIETNNEVAETAKEEVDRQAGAIQADIWKNAKGSQRDKRDGKQTFDLGSEKRVSEISDILDEFNIDTYGTGHIDLKDLSKAMAERGDEFKKALEESDTKGADEILQLMNENSDRIKQASDAMSNKTTAELDNIGLEHFKEGDITDVNSYNKKADEMAQAAISSGQFKPEEYDQALDWSRDYIAKMDEVGSKIEGYRSMLQGVIDEELLPTNLIDNYTTERFEDAKVGMEMLDKAAKDSGYTLEELVTKYGSLDEAINYMTNNGYLNWYDFEKYQESIYLSLDGMENAFDGTGKSYNDLLALLRTDNPLEGSWMDPEQYNEAMNKALEYGMETGVADLYGYFTVEDWEKILNADNIEDAIQETVGEHLGEFKENFVNSQAAQYTEGIGNILANKRNYTNESFGQDETVQNLIANKQVIGQILPDLQDELDILDSQNASLEEKLAALEKIQQVTGAMAKDQDGIFTKEDAEAAQLTVDGLTDSYNKGIITQEEYNQKLQGTIDAELDAIGVSEEEFDSYVEGLQSVSKNLEKNDKLAKKVAIDNKKLEKSIEGLSDNFEEYGSIIKSGDKNNIKYAQGINKIRESAEEMLGTDLDDDFIAEHLEEIEKLANGDLTVFDELQKAATQKIIMEIAAEIDDPALQSTLTEIDELIQNADIEDLEVGASLDGTEFGNTLAELVNSSNLSVEEMEKIFDSFGWEPSVDYEEVDANSVNLAQTHAYIQGADGTYQEITDQAQLETQEKVYIPKINSSATVYKGSPKNTITPKKSSGGGGGGGGGSKEKDPDKMDKLDDEIDRYHDINIQIKQLETAYDRLDKAQDKLIGKDLIDNLNQQLAVLDKQIEAYQTKLALERQEAEELKGDLGAKGVQFNEDGTIANYAESLKAQERYVNDLIEKYNSMSAEEQESYKEVVEKAKEDYEKFKENIDRYDTVITEEIPELEDKTQELIDKQIEINIKKFTMKVDLRLEMKQAEEDWNKFKRKIIDGIKDENILGQGKESLENLRDYYDLGDGTGTVQSLTNQVNNTMAEINKMRDGETSDVYGDNMAKALEDLNKYNSELMTQLEDIDDLVASVEQGYLDTMDEINDKMKEQVEAYEYVNELIDSDVELIKLLYGEDAYDSLGKYYDQKHDNYLKALEFDRQEVSFWEDEMNRAKEAGDTEAYNKALENYRESVSKLNEDVKASVQNIIDSYSNTINKVFDDLDKKFTGGKGLDLMQEEWELINTNADRYLDTINSTYEVQKLQNKYKDSIKNTDSTSAQKKLNDLMQEEIGMLEKKDKLSQYDIDRANMKYEIALKQIALEEAQKNKSSMKMKRDSQGNYSYVYAGDEDDISSKQQELADAQNQLYNLDKDQYQSNLNDMMSYYSEFTEKYKELMLDTTLSDEEREAKKKVLVEQYGQLINSIQMDNETIRSNLSESTFDMLDVLYETDAASFETMTGLNTNNWETMSDEMINKIQTDMVPNWDSSVQGMIDKIAAEGGLEPTCKAAFEEIDTAVQDFTKSLEDIEDAAGISFDAIADGQDATLDKNKDLIQDNKEIIDQAKEQLKEYQNLRAEVDKLAKSYDGVRDAAVRAAEAAHTLAEEINQTTLDAKDNTVLGNNGGDVDNNGPGGKNPGGGGGTSGGNGDGSGSGDGSGVKSPSNPTPAATKKYYVKASHGSYGSRTFATFTSRGQAQSYIVSNQGKLKYNGVYYTSPTIVEGYKTGGYTGDWSGGIGQDGGRLALLHQKELVLNAEDTENYLKAVEEMRALQDELRSGSSMSILGNMFDAIGDSITDRIKMYQDELERSDFKMSQFGMETSSTSQNIVINAEFPDVSDAAEIQKAFDQILGMASQKANNKNR